MEEWTCPRCGDAFFGIPPECRLCIACQEETGEHSVCAAYRYLLPEDYQRGQS